MSETIAMPIPMALLLGFGVVGKAEKVLRAPLIVLHGGAYGAANDALWGKAA